MTSSLPSTLQLASTAVTLREATVDDLAAIVDLLADDQLGTSRESTADLAPYRSAYDALAADPAHLLLVGADEDRVVATLQLSFIPGLARSGAWRAQIEAVRVHRDFRSQGLGAAIVEWSIEESRRRGCALVQLTTDKSRTDAHRFYERLGFRASHEGLKLRL